MTNELKRIVGRDERIMYEGRPNKKCYIFEAIFNPLLPIAVVWAIFDFGILGNALFGGLSGAGGISFVLIPFMLLHLMPVWIYLGGVLFSAKKYRNTYYIVTDRAVYVSGGIFTKNIQSKPFAELSHIDLHRGIFDQMFNVGDIILTTDQLDRNNRSVTVNINSISNYAEIYNMVKKLQMDIYSDVMYPNAKRPADNPGYNTKYRGM